MYWIDPNGNDISDAVKVFCRMQTGETCFDATDIRPPTYSVDDWEVSAAVSLTIDD